MTKKTLFKITAVGTLLVLLLLLVWNYYPYFNTEPVIVGTRDFFRGTHADINVSLGKVEWSNPYNNFQTYEGVFYYKDEENLMKWNEKKNKAELLFTIGDSFWIWNQEVYYIKEDTIYKRGLNAEVSEEMLDILPVREGGCYDIEGENLYYFSKVNRVLNCYNMRTGEQLTYDVTYDNDWRQLWVKGNGMAVVDNSDKSLVLYQLDSGKKTSIKLAEKDAWFFGAKTNKSVYLCVAGNNGPKPADKKNLGEDAVYEIDFDELTVTSKSDESFEWLVATPEKIYGVKKNVLRMFKLEEIK